MSLFYYRLGDESQVAYHSTCGRNAFFILPAINKIYLWLARYCSFPFSFFLNVEFMHGKSIPDKMCQVILQWCGFLI